MKRIDWCLINGKEIDVTRDKTELVRVNVIDLDSQIAQYIADFLEAGYSYEQTCLHVNKLMREQNETCITLSAVYGCARRLNPLITSVKKRKQGSIDPEDPWCIARKNWVTQLLVRLGVLKYECKDGLSVPTYFDLDKMVKLSLSQIVFWDEMHRKVRIGCTKQYTYRFRRDENGKLLQDGNYESKKEYLNTKYSDEIRLCVGVAMTEQPNGDLVGRRCNVFDYSGKVILSKSQYDGRLQSEIERVRKLKLGGEWKRNNRPPNTLYADDEVIEISGVGPAKVKLLNSQELFTVRDILNCKEEIKGFTRAQLTSIMRQVDAALTENKPPDLVEDFRKSANPYEDRYGENWISFASKVSGMSGYVTITDMVQHIIDESGNIMKGTKHESDCFFITTHYHL